jgi:uracil-DNA glycosylase family 4
MARIGFFTASDFTPSPSTHLPLVAQCGICRLHEHCRSPKMPLDGRGSKKVLIVGEAPGATEDIQNRPFVGKAGQYLKNVLNSIGVDFRRDCWIYNSAICRPAKNKLPPKAIDHCRPNVINTINKLKPEVIILLGKTAVKSLIGYLWKEDVKDMNRWVGWQIPCQRLSGREFNTWICPTWHPSFIMRDQEDDSSGVFLKKGQQEVFEMLFRKHLQAAFSLDGRPWQTVPDYKNRVEIILNDEEAAKAILGFINQEKPTAFDYETTCLKPDSSNAEIVSCSLSNGERTIAYPWYGKARKATGEFLRSPLPKDGANIKFEERWTWKEFGHGVNNWRHCAVTGMHVLDNRQGICGVKFQSFVVLGQESYDDNIKPYLKASGGCNEPNRIREVNIKKLLLYNGMDSLLEHLLAKWQRKKFGLE